MVDDTTKPAPEAPMAVWVKGGTTRLADDQKYQREHAEAEARRDAEAARHQAAINNPMEAKVYTTALTNKQRDAMVVLGFKPPKEDRIENYMMCELHSWVGDEKNELVLQICCPYCITKHHRHAGQAQFHIRQSHRMFEVDRRTAQQRKPHPLGLPIAAEIWVNPENPSEAIECAGTVTTHGWISCDGTNCTWSFRIDDSVIITRSK